MTLGCGEHVIELTVEDGQGGSDTDEVVVAVTDTVGPSVTALLVPREESTLGSRREPMSGNGYLYEVQCLVSDVCDEAPQIVGMDINGATVTDGQLVMLSGDDGEGHESAGEALEPFFKTIMEKGKFTGARCDSCGFTYVPTTIFCEQCFTRINKIVPIDDWGIIESFTISFLDVDGNWLDEPIIWGLIRLNGASTTLVHKLLCDPEDLNIGMEVKAKFKPKNKREGGMEDIEGFVIKK